MRFLLQRVRSASVAVAGGVVGSIGAGLLVLVGIGHGDDGDTAQRMVDKALNLRIFEDAAGRMNLSILDREQQRPGSSAILVVSQFTLYADVRKGRRPSFTDSAPPELAAALVDQVAGLFAASGVTVASGQFGADMLVALENDGPVTIWLDSAALGM